MNSSACAGASASTGDLSLDPALAPCSVDLVALQVLYGLALAVSVARLVVCAVGALTFLRLGRLRSLSKMPFNSDLSFYSFLLQIVSSGAFIALFSLKLASLPAALIGQDVAATVLFILANSLVFFSIALERFGNDRVIRRLKLFGVLSSPSILVVNATRVISYVDVVLGPASFALLAGCLGAQAEECASLASIHYYAIASLMVLLAVVTITRVRTLCAILQTLHEKIPNPAKRSLVEKLMADLRALLNPTYQLLPFMALAFAFGADPLLARQTSYFVPVFCIFVSLAWLPISCRQVIKLRSSLRRTTADDRSSKLLGMTYDHSPEDRLVVEEEPKVSSTEAQSTSLKSPARRRTRDSRRQREVRRPNNPLSTILSSGAMDV